MKMDRMSLSRLPRPMDTLLLLLFLVTPDVSSEGTELFSCDFEDDLCGLIQGTDDHFDWTRHQGPTDTGPSEAYHGAYYIYAEANNHPGQGANLRTPNLDYQGMVCVTFAYHMYGQGWHFLQLATSPSDAYIQIRRSDHDNHWKKWAQRVTLAKGNWIQIRAFISYTDTSDIAVDDLVIREGSCKDVFPLPYHCSFESGLCGMTQGHDDRFDWTRYNRSTGSSYTGPRNAYEGHWFIYIEARTPGIYNGHTAVIETPAFNHTGTLCLRFNYHMYGKQGSHVYSVGTLTAWHEDGTTSTRVFEETGHKGNRWLSAGVNVTGFHPGDWITFRASMGDSIFGDIAVDNINIATGGCRDCHIFNGSCQHLCIPESTGDRCACHHGYRLEGDTMCTDIVECFENTARCSQLCDNTDGGFTCHCNDGFSLGKDNSTCQDIDECSEKIAACSQRCKNIVGGFICHCNDGFLLDKDITTCQDDSSGSSLWKILVGVGPGSAVILAVVVLVVVIIRRRRMTSPNDDHTVTYENDNVGISSAVTMADDPNNPPEAGVYQEINTTGYVNMFDMEPNPTVEYQNDVIYAKDPYQKLGSNREPLPNPYDTLNE